MNILLVGPSGSGKSSVAKELCLQFENRQPGHLWYHVSSGDIARSIATNKDKEDFKQGKLFQDERLMRWTMLSHINNMHYGNRINNQTDIDVNMVFDGFPRTPEQLGFMFAAEIPINYAFYMNIGLDTAIERIKDRGRDDIDTVETVVNRINNEHNTLIDLWSSIKFSGIKNLWMEIDGLNIFDVVTLILSELERM
jgi:adenylate kinase family enzyme